MMLHVANRNHPNSACWTPTSQTMLMYGYQPDGSFKLVGVMFLADNAYPGRRRLRAVRSLAGTTTA